MVQAGCRRAESSGSWWLIYKFKTKHTASSSIASRVPYLSSRRELGLLVPARANPGGKLQGWHSLAKVQQLSSKTRSAALQKCRPG